MSDTIIISISLINKQMDYFSVIIVPGCTICMIGLAIYFVRKCRKTEANQKQESHSKPQKKKRKNARVTEDVQMDPVESREHNPPNTKLVNAPVITPVAPVIVPIESRRKQSVEMDPKQIEGRYGEHYYGTVSLKGNGPGNNMTIITAICMRHSKILLANSKNELIMYDLRKWKKESQNQGRYFTSLENNSASAVAIGNNFYYVALNFDKTIAYYSFEQRVYFKEEMRFPRGILKTNASSIYVTQSEQFVVSTGSEADTTINVWSRKGDKLAQLNTYQLEHYDIKYSDNYVIVRGWTSEVKVFEFVCDKTSKFIKIEKIHHLPHSDPPKCSSIDSLHALTVCKSNGITLWPLSNLSRAKAADCLLLGLDNVEICAVHTVKDMNQRYRTITVFGDGNSRIVVCNDKMKVLKLFEGVEHQEIYLVGSIKNVVMATLNNTGRLFLWNITNLVAQVQEYAL